MKESLILETDNMTEAQAKDEVARMMVEIRHLRVQIDRDHELGQQIKARTDATMSRVQDGLARLESSG